MKKMKLVDRIIKEPIGGAHRNKEKTFEIVKEAILNAYNEFKEMSSSELVKRRMNKYSNMGVYKS
jgi:acetyl-CoA carboxylase carboxyl transferase subunit alpha